MSISKNTKIVSHEVRTGNLNISNVLGQKKSPKQKFQTHSNYWFNVKLTKD